MADAVAIGCGGIEMEELRRSGIGGMVAKMMDAFNPMNKSDAGGVVGGAIPSEKKK